MSCTVYTRSNTNDENNGTQLHLQRKQSNKISTSNTSSYKENDRNL